MLAPEVTFNIQEPCTFILYARWAELWCLLPLRYVTVRLAARCDGGPTDPQGAATDAVQVTLKLQLITE
jgi:hypothetical protein